MCPDSNMTCFSNLPADIQRHIIEMSMPWVPGLEAGSQGRRVAPWAVCSSWRALLLEDPNDFGSLMYKTRGAEALPLIAGSGVIDDEGGRGRAVLLAVARRLEHAFATRPCSCMRPWACWDFLYDTFDQEQVRDACVLLEGRGRADLAAELRACVVSLLREEKGDRVIWGASACACGARCAPVHEEVEEEVEEEAAPPPRAPHNRGRPRKCFARSNARQLLASRALNLRVDIHQQMNRSCLRPHAANTAFLNQKTENHTNTPEL